MPVKPSAYSFFNRFRMRVSTSAVDASIDRWARAASSDSENVRYDATNAWVTDWIHNGSCCAIAASTADRNDAADGPMCCTASRRRSVRKRANCCADGGIGGTEIMVRRVSATEAVALRFSVAPSCASAEQESVQARPRYVWISASAGIEAQR